MEYYWPEGIMSLGSWLVCILTFVTVGTGMSLKDLMQADKTLEDRP